MTPRGLSHMSFPSKVIWGVKAPQRVSFVWMTALGKILACKNLLKMDYSIMSWCCVCKCSEETVNHHLIHCCVAFELWSYVFRSFGIQWVLQVRSLTYYVGGRMGS